MVSGLVLLAATFRLWVPGCQSSFPQVPLLGWAVSAGPIWDWVGLIVLVSCLLASAVFSDQLSIQSDTGHWSSRSIGAPVHRLLLWAIVCSASLLVVLNQHRLQAWFFQLLLFSFVFLLSDEKRRLRWLQWLVVSLYAYSACGKLDYEFLHTTGQDFLRATVAPLGLDIEDWPQSRRLAVTALAPLSELAMAAGLLWRPTRKFCGFLAVGCHLFMVWLLGFQLHQSLGVCLWNLQFAAQSLALFALPSIAGENSNSPKPSMHRPGIVLREYAIQTLLAASLVLPLSERLGWWDHWPSWALYSSHNSRLYIVVAPWAIDRLPRELQSLIQQHHPTTVGGYTVPLAEWSVRTLGVPVYPQARFQLGVARALSDTVDAKFAISAQVCSAANRLNGQRDKTRWLLDDQLHAASRNFWLNSQPRQVWMPSSQTQSSSLAIR
ncbi:MAG: hypothetical protein KF752_12560 [Pirellulaceae bacterium]|nr:hypothetical protein [Pirellulaceae bacterium]